MNFFCDNDALQFHFRNFPWDEIITLRENGFTLPNGFKDTASAMAVISAKLSQIGELSGGPITARATEVDRIGVSCANNAVVLPEATLHNLADLKAAGVLGVTLPREYGGLFFPQTAYCMMTEMISRADASLQNLFGLQSIADTLALFGTEKQKAANLPQCGIGEIDGAMALTEPEAGSDLQSITTTATLGDDGVWRLNGIKHFITNGNARLLLVLARSEAGTTDARGLSLFLAHQCPELTIHHIAGKMGLHGSPLCELRFQNAPAELIGQRRYGLIKYVKNLMNSARLSICAQAVGISEACRQAAWRFCRSRKQFGQPLTEIPQVNEMLTRLDCLTAAQRTLLYFTSLWIDRREALRLHLEYNAADSDAKSRLREASAACDLLIPMTKAFNGEAANQCAYDAMQCHGGRGYMRGCIAERLYRDARILNIYEGTTQMQVTAATAELRKSAIAPLFAELDNFSYSAKTSALLSKVIAARKHIQDVQSAIPESKSSLLSRRVVRALTLLLAAELLLQEASADDSRLAVAQRFLWEYLPEAEMHAQIIADTNS